MDRFLEDARNILEAAERVSASGQAVSDLTILVGAEGGIQMVAGSDWPLERLLVERCARAAFRVGERQGRVSLEGRCGARSCRLEADTPQRIARWLLDGPVPPRFAV